MRLFRQLHISKIVLLVKAHTALPPTKESTNLFHLLLISVHLDVNIMFMFLILLCIRQCMTMDGEAFWLDMGE